MQVDCSGGIVGSHDAGYQCYQGKKEVTVKVTDKGARKKSDCKEPNTKVVCNRSLRRQRGKKEGKGAGGDVRF